MNRVAVVSSNLASVGYDEVSRVLEVEFKHGGVYRYSGVPERVYVGLITAESVGGYFHANIKKGNQYPYRKVN